MSCRSWQRHTAGCLSQVRTLPLPADAFACWWRPCGVTWDAVPKQSWYQSCGDPPPNTACKATRAAGMRIFVLITGLWLWAAAFLLDCDGRMRSAEHHILRHGGGHIFPGVSNPAVYIYTVVIFWFDWRFLFILRHLNCWGFSPSLPRWTIPENYCANPPKKIADRNSSFLLHGILWWGNILRWPSQHRYGIESMYQTKYVSFTFQFPQTNL